MMSIAQVVGVDPGLVHTGVVSMIFRESSRTVTVRHTLVQGPDADEVAKWIRNLDGPYPKVYIEQYRTRQSFGTDARMQAAEQDLRKALPAATFLPNMGIKRVITQAVMELLDVWRWGTATHHQDLRSAARIALQGMVKLDVTNKLLADVVRDYVAGSPWPVTHE